MQIDLYAQPWRAARKAAERAAEQTGIRYIFFLGGGRLLE
jgi:hypothetical protein